MALRSDPAETPAEVTAPDETAKDPAAPRDAVAEDPAAPREAPDGQDEEPRTRLEQTPQTSVLSRKRSYDETEDGTVPPPDLLSANEPSDQPPAAPPPLTKKQRARIDVNRRLALSRRADPWTPLTWEDERLNGLFPENNAEDVKLGTLDVSIVARFRFEEHDASPGQDVCLKREPNNPVDSNAILVYNAKDEPIGYIAAKSQRTPVGSTQANALAPLLDDESPLAPRIEAMIPTETEHHAGPSAVPGEIVIKSRPSLAVKVCAHLRAHGLALRQNWLEEQAAAM